MKKLLSGPILLGLISLFYSEPIKADIRSNCFAEWGEDYSMVEWCINEQSNAERNIYNLPDNNIKNNCFREWGEDYAMVEWCIKEQSGALQRIRDY